MRDFHQDKDRYFRMQYATAKEHIIPFVEAAIGPIEGKRVLEIGCAEAGVLKAFLENGCSCVGVELSPSRVELARQYHKAALEDGKVSFLNENIYNIDVDRDCGGAFDLIILKDVIEHIPEQEKIIVRLKDFLKPGGVIFFGFPPWQMPFGGHQQIAKSMIMSHLPYFHLLPKRIYLKALSMLFDDFSEARSRYDLGEFVHSNREGVNGGGAMTAEFYGETFIPEKYARSAYSDLFDLEKFLFNPPRQTHPIMFFKRKKHPS